MPQAWFAHFYAIGACWNVVVAALFLTTSYPGMDPWSQVRMAAAGRGGTCTLPRPVCPCAQGLLR